MSENKMQDCLCCGVTSSAGSRVNKDLIELLGTISRDLQESGCSRSLIAIAKWRLDRVALGVTNMGRPTMLAYPDHAENALEAYKRLGDALRIEGKIK